VSIDKARIWFNNNGWTPADFQIEAWTHYLEGKSGIVNAPTGSGKTYALLIPVLLNSSSNDKGLQMIWITPIKALAKEIKLSADRAVKGLGLDWKVELRTGDTTSTNRKKQWTDPPHILITTPESIHVMMATKGYRPFFKSIKSIIVDEWHELIGSKRGVQMELGISCIKGINPKLQVWGISATIGNMQEAIEVLHGSNAHETVLVKANIQKEIEVKTVIPESIERFPWAGHLGITMAHQVCSIIDGSGSTLIFTNTRAQCEIWYQRLLDIREDLAGQMAMHHGSISKEIRDWVEESLYDGKLKVVVCTSSLDLGVDFRPVETIVQIGSPKGVARFMQRAGRSGHSPGAVSKIFFIPTHSIELIEAAALRSSIIEGDIEERIPYIRSFDVLIQYLMTLAVSDGFIPHKVHKELLATFSYQDMTDEEWNKVISFLLTGGKSLGAYDEYRKIVIENGVYKVENRGIALRHRMSIGTIVSDAMVKVTYANGKYLGTVEEWFISNLEIGDAFWFAGRPLELIRLKEMTAQVKDTKKKNTKIPSYMGGRLQLSTQLSQMLREKMNDYLNGNIKDVEIQALVPLFETQQERSLIPNEKQFLIEYYKSDEGYHLMFFPFEGRSVHEGMASLIGKRISYTHSISFSIAMNDYGFELLSDKKIDIEKVITHDLFSESNLMEDIQSSINAVELAKRNFRDIAMISGLVFQGYPGQKKKDRHLQSSSQLLFNVFREYEPDNLLYLQTYEEIRTFQLEEVRMRNALRRIKEQEFKFVHLEKPSPFGFPLIVDRLREKMSSERLEDRIKKMVLL
jgi:ATP-dependent helicase Lhr and Lhr-like helicase